MSMRVRYGASPHDIPGFDNQRLRDEFLLDTLFEAGKLNLTYTHIDRMIVGGAVPIHSNLSITDGKQLGTRTFFEAREMGVANLGGKGRISVDGRDFELDNRDIVYVGRGAKSVEFASHDPNKPAWFYINSVPAGANHPHRLIRKQDAKTVEMGEQARANKRRLAMYIHPEVAPSCLLLMGITDLAPASVWNTMPPHLHERRMEAYLYFEMADDDRVFHFMGQPEQTRHLVVANGQGVLSPAWSIHMGAGTGPYAFVWGMTGENQAYTDFNPVPVGDLK